MNLQAFLPFFLDEGTLDNSATSYTMLSDDITLGTPTREGYTFKGWTGDNGTTPQTEVIISKGSTGDKKFTANWTANAFAVYSGTDNSLRFYNRDVEIPEEGEIFNDLEASSIYLNIETVDFTEAEEPVWSEHSEDVTMIKVEDSINPVSLSYWFAQMLNVSYIDVNELDTAGIESMHKTFCYTGRYAEEFEIYGLDDWDMSSVTDAYDMFCRAGESATTWSIGDLSDWDISSLENAQAIFFHAGASATEWSIGDLSKWNTSSLTNAYNMFTACGQNATEYFSLGDLSTKVVTKDDGSTYLAWDVSKVQYMDFMFCLSGQNATDDWFIGDISNWNTTSCENMRYMFQKTGTAVSSWFVGDLRTKSVSLSDGTTYTAWDVSNVQDMDEMFDWAGMYSEYWSIGDISNWNVSNVGNMFAMFRNSGRYNATDWYIGDISNWDVSNVTNMNRMFFYAGANATYSLDLSNWNVDNVTDYEYFNTGVSAKVLAPAWTN